MIASSAEFDSRLTSARAALACGNDSDATRLLREAIGTSDRSAIAEAELAVALSALGALRRDAQDALEAEELYLRALSVLDTAAEPDESLLVTVLTGLGGVLAAREAYSAAEPLLARLHELKRRTKGEDHLEAATVLASLAAVRHALGRHDEAESMWRHVLAVRERTLAPNHFATATALERLAESCAARGKVNEALRLLHRATSMRELTLGRSHPSLRIARDRIADLQLQASDVAQDGLVDSSSPLRVRPPRPFAAPSAEDDLPFDEHGGHTRLIYVPGARATLLAMQSELDGATADEKENAGAPEWERQVQPPNAAMAMLLRRKGIPAIVAVAAMVVLLLGIAATRSRAETRVDALPDTAAFTKQDSSGPVAAHGPVASPVLSSTETPILFAPASSVSTVSAARSRPAGVQLANGTLAGPTSELPALVAPAVSGKLLRELDASARSVMTPTAPTTEPHPVRLAAEAPVRRFAPGSDESVDLVRARLTGVMPQPRYPAVLRYQNVQGEVSVKFTVDALGRPVLTSVAVVRSPHELLSDAVRKVIPGMRFEPARRSNIGAAAEPDEVQMSFQFRTSTP